MWITVIFMWITETDLLCLKGKQKLAEDGKGRTCKSPESKGRNSSCGSMRYMFQRLKTDHNANFVEATPIYSCSLGHSGNTISFFSYFYELQLYG